MTDSVDTVKALSVRSMPSPMTSADWVSDLMSEVRPKNMSTTTATSSTSHLVRKNLSRSLTATAWLALLTERLLCGSVRVFFLCRGGYVRALRRGGGSG